MEQPESEITEEEVKEEKEEVPEEPVQKVKTKVVDNDLNPWGVDDDIVISEDMNIQQEEFKQNEDLDRELLESNEMFDGMVLSETAK